MTRERLALLQHLPHLLLSACRERSCQCRASAVPARWALGIRGGPAVLWADLMTIVGIDGRFPEDPGVRASDQFWPISAPRHRKPKELNGLPAATRNAPE